MEEVMKKATRDSYGEALVELGQETPNIVVFDADLAGATKTGRGTRNILLPASTAQLLSERKKHSWSEWIFPNPLKPESPTNPRSAYGHLKALLDSAGLPNIRFHDLRHTFATHALTSGVDVKTLSGILGHTRAAFTLDTYTHVTTDAQLKAAQTMGNILSRAV